MKTKSIIIFLIFISSNCINIYAQSLKCNQGDQNQSKNNSSSGTNKGPNSSSQTSVLASSDPNEIIGLAGFDTLQWVNAEDRLAYTIFFENDPDFATAAAQKVEVRYAFDPKVNMYSFSLGSFGFGEHLFPVEGNPNVYQTRLDLRDAMGIYVDVVAGLDVVKKEAFWIFSSIDPETGLPPLEPEKGFLPVNDKEIRNGEGFVTFTIVPSENCATRDTVSAQASIVFDTNEAIETNSWQNTIDAGVPQSKVKGTVNPENDSEYFLSFEANDDSEGSGVKQLIVFISENKESYTEYEICAPDSMLVFEITDGAEYAFYSIAEDNTGNREKQKSKADFILNANLSPTDLFLSNTTFRDDIAIGGFIGQLSTEDTGEDQSFVYELAEGEGAIHNDFFQVNGSRLETAVSFKCEEIIEYGIRLKTTDIGGLSFSKAFTLNLEKTLNKPEPDTLTVYICNGDSYEFYGTEYDQAGFYSYYRENEFECDSIYVLDLRINTRLNAPIITVENTHTLVSSAISDNQWYNESGAVEGAVGQSFTPTETGMYYVTVSNGECESEPSEKYYVDLSGKTNLNWDLKKGYTWISLNGNGKVNPITLLTPMKSRFEQLLSFDSELINDPANGIVGGLKEISPENSYKIKMTGDGKLDYSGNAASTGDYPITLFKGWNWIGYLPSIELDINSALSGLKAENGDIIKSLTDFSVYDKVWTGTLTSLKPGEGYIYYSVSGKTFIYSSLRVNRPDMLGKSNAMYLRNNSVSWDYNPNQYPDNMNVIAELHVESQIPEEGIYTVGAFAGEECRGIGKYVGGKLFITVHGKDTGETISFKAMENASGKEFDIKETLLFKDDLIGSIARPYLLTLTGYTGIDAADFVLTIYPNPVKNILYLAGNLPEIKNLKVLSVNGNVMIVADHFMKEAGLDVSALPEGIYILAITTEKNIIYRKFIK